MKNILFFILVLTLFASCVKNEDPDGENEEELITTLIMQLTPNNGTGVVNLEFVDLDGDGGNPPTISGGTLAINTTYTAEITVLNESESPAEDITEEILEEADEHQFFLTLSGSLDLNWSYLDEDSEGYPVGLSMQLVTGATAGTGTLRVTLRHEPNKSAANVAGGNIANAGGETDIEVDFPITIQ